VNRQRPYRAVTAAGQAKAGPCPPHEHLGARQASRSSPRRCGRHSDKADSIPPKADFAPAPAWSTKSSARIHRLSWLRSCAAPPLRPTLACRRSAQSDRMGDEVTIFHDCISCQNGHPANPPNSKRPTWHPMGEAGVYRLRVVLSLLVLGFCRMHCRRGDRRRVAYLWAGGVGLGEEGGL